MLIVAGIVLHDPLQKPADQLWGQNIAVQTRNSREIRVDKCIPQAVTLIFVCKLETFFCYPGLCTISF